MLMRSRLLLSLFFSCLLTLSCRKSAPAKERSFFMGVTPWPADFTGSELDSAYTFINEHCDLVSQHFDDGIPYEEAYKVLAFPGAMQDELNIRKSKTPPGKKILLSISALDLSRKARAGYYARATTADSIRQRWSALPFDNAQVVIAYVNFVSRLIDFFQPGYVNYAVESNNSLWDPSAFAAYRRFLSQVYTMLKTDYPSLPMLASLMVDESAAGFAHAQQLLPVTDYIALSAYPYVHVSSSAGGNTDPSLFPTGYFTRFADLDPTKPLAIAETGYIAEDLVIPAYSLSKTGKPEWQEGYLSMLAEFCQQRQARFLIWFCHKDYDAGDNRLKSLGLYQDLFGIWEDTGLKDEAGSPRPAWFTWLQWMNRRKTGN